MQSTRYFCDICKEEFKPQDLIPANLMGKNIDLCAGCNQKLINAFCDLVDENIGGKK